MNTPESPLNPETLDELLSADIDGELADAAADLGLTLGEATAAIEAAPGSGARRAALVRARGLIGTPAPLSESEELWLVGAAIARSTDELRTLRERPRRARQALTAIGSAAAAAAVIAGIVVLAARNPASTSKSSSNASLTVPQRGVASPAPHAASVQLRSIEFGDVSNPRTLGAEVEARLAVSATPLTPADIPSPATPGPAGGQILQGGSGDLGLVGPQGPSGAQGGTGVAGGIGPQGPTGPVGATGPSGAQGATGVVGPGPTGPTALSAVPVPSGLLRAGPQGVTGPRGVTGAQGGIGAIGAQGVQGDEGIVGTQGPTGPLYNSANKSASGRLAQSADAVRAEPVCTAAIRRRAGLNSAPVLSGTGTDAGLPAVVVVFAHGRGYVAYVLAASDCSLLSQQTLP